MPIYIGLSGINDTGESVLVSSALSEGEVTKLLEQGEEEVSTSCFRRRKPQLFHYPIY